MKQILLAVAVTLVFGLAVLAQDTTQSSPQTGSQPSATSSSASGQQTSDTAAGSQSSTSSAKSESTTSAKGEKKLRGCIQSQGGQYVLQERHGKQVALTGSADFASHVGHTVTVHGSYEAGSSASASTSTSGSEKLPSSPGSSTANPTPGMSSSASAGQQFMVTKIDHESDTCKLEKGSKSKANPSSTAPNAPPSTPPQQ